MTSTTLSSTRLPKALALTEALVSPPVTPAQPPDIPKLRRTIASCAELVPKGERFQVDGFLLRTVASEPGRIGNSDEFAWSPVTARRRLGLAAVRSCIRGLHRTPAEAVHAVVDASIVDAEEGRERPASLACWLNQLPMGGRAVAEAEAIHWATDLLSSLEWRELGCNPVLGLDQWWDCPPSGGLVLQGRAEVRAALRDPDRHEGKNATTHRDGSSHPGSTLKRETALFTMISGRPSAVAGTELGLAALVALLADPDAPPPVRAVGWWPQCGRALVVTMDAESFQTTADAVAAAVASVAKHGFKS